ncbi:hypothetical protein EJ02DRAFT_459784 [Clathrospora elynae]|uniref:Uncharacterized protein n=1 Tax=Clathrospora elynae TaxID=706981 RepID=A0A6A5S6A6_9PLEO|nr:hypothetical protein EJ02DRAFT_459784 [Clathrospora elynae]
MSLRLCEDKKGSSSSVIKGIGFQKGEVSGSTRDGEGHNPSCPEFQRRFQAVIWHISAFVGSLQTTSSSHHHDARIPAKRHLELAHDLVITACSDVRPKKTTKKCTCDSRNMNGRDLICQARPDCTNDPWLMAFGLRLWWLWLKRGSAPLHVLIGRHLPEPR